jgi:hypothetical protein
MVLLLSLLVGCGEDLASTNEMSVEWHDLAGVDFTGVDFTMPKDGPMQSDGPMGDGPMQSDGPPQSDGFAGDLAKPADLAGMTSTVGVMGHIGCGSQTCNTPGYCCVKATGYECGGGDGLMCVFAGGDPVFCDSAASACIGGNICCFDSGVADCKSSCNSPAVQVCDPNVLNECKTGTCQPYTGTKLPAGYYTCQ